MLFRSVGVIDEGPRRESRLLFQGGGSLSELTLAVSPSCHESTFHRLCLPQVSRAEGSVAIEGTLVCPVVKGLRVSNVVPVNTISSSMFLGIPTR